MGNIKNQNGLDICGGDAIYIPTGECDSCETFLRDLREVQRLLTEKQDKLKQGAGIEIANDNTISAQLHHGNTYTKTDVDTRLTNLHNTITNETDAKISDAVSDLEDEIAAIPITKVKGNAETSYRTGNVNLTPANIGAVNKAGDTMSGNLSVVIPGSASARGESAVVVGNAIPEGTANNSTGRIVIYGKGSNASVIRADNVTGANHTVQLPNKGGTVALLDDLPAAVAVKGNAETAYRTGNVNLTPANIGAVNKAGDTMTGNLTINRENGTASTTGTSVLSVGNATKTGTAGNSKGFARLYSDGASFVQLSAASTDSSISQVLQAKAGTIALLSDIPSPTTRTTTLGSQDTTNYEYQTIEIIKNGGVVSFYFKIRLKTARAANTIYQLGILPAHFRPAASWASFPELKEGGFVVSTGGYVWIRANGVVYLYNGVARNNYTFTCSGSFATDNYDF